MRSSVALVGMVGLCSATLALAQAAPPAASSPPPPTSTPPPPPGAAPRAGDRPVEAAPPPPSLGFRIGGSTGIGAFLPGPMISFHLFDVQAGVQVNPMFGAYLRLGYSASIGFGVTAGPSGGSVSVAGAGFWLIGANAELGLGDAFFLAAGPQVGIGGWGRTRVAASDSGGGVETIASAGAQPGLDLRLGVGLGPADPVTGRRKQFTIALDVSLLYATNVVSASVMGGTQGASIAVGFSEALSVVPTLHLGYQFR